MLKAVWMEIAWLIRPDHCFWTRCRHERATTIARGSIVALNSRRSRTVHALIRNFASNVANIYLYLSNHVPQNLFPKHSYSPGGVVSFGSQ